jgi:hypothetical protein
MGKAIVQNIPLNSKYVRYHYERAYAGLRQFYRACATANFTDDELMDIKYDLWRTHGKYLDIAWQHHFALKVAWKTGIGTWHGWHNAARLHQYASDWNSFIDRCLPIPF